MTTLHEHLGQLVRYAPPGTLVPVDSLAELLRTYDEEEKPAAPTGLSLGEVAERFSRIVDGNRKTPQEGTVRKWIGRGLRGVKLKAFRAGRHLRVLEGDLEAFIQELAERSSTRAGNHRDSRVPAAPVQPETELEAFLTHFRQPAKRSASRPEPGRRASRR